MNSKREPSRPAATAKDPAFAPIRMNPDAIDQLPSNVTKLPRRDHHRDQEPEDDRRVVGFGDHMPAFLGRARASRSL